MLRSVRLLSVLVLGVCAAATLSAQTELKLHYRWNNQFSVANKDTKVIRPVFQYVADKVGVKIKDVANPVATNDTQEFQLAATEQFTGADIYGGASLAEYFYSYGNDGAFVDLMAAMKAGKLPNFKKFTDANPDVLAAIVTPEGKLFHLPYVPDGGVARMYFIRTDWLAKLKLNMPKTTEELEKVLKAFRDKDPNGNGKRDEIPVFNDKLNEIMRTMNLWNARVYGNDNYGVRVVADARGGKMYHAWLDPRFKTAMKEFQRWYREGLIDPEAFTRKENTARKDLLTKLNVGGMTHEWVASTSGYNYDPALKKAWPDFKFEVMAPVAWKGAKAFEEHARIIVKPDGWGISAKSKNVDAALKYIDYFFSEDGRNTTNFGVKGQTWTDLDKNGDPIFTPAALAWMNEAGGMNRALWDKQGAQAPLGYFQNFAYEIQWTLPIGQAGVAIYRDPKQVTYANQTPVFAFAKSEFETVNSITDQLNTYLAEAAVNFITGRVDVEKGWNEYVAKANELGAPKLVAVYQAAYDRFLKGGKK